MDNERMTLARLRASDAPTLSVEQAGQVLGLSRRSAYRAASAGQIPTIRLGRRLAVPRLRLLAMLGAGEHEAA